MYKYEREFNVGRGCRDFVISKRPTLKTIVSIIERDFVPKGARKHKHSYVWPVTNGFSGWLGLNTILARADDAVGLNPIVGIVSEEIEAILRSTSAWPQPAPTISISLGYLLPEKRYIEWAFATQSTSSLEVEAEKLIACVMQYAVPFIESNASLPAIVANLEQMRPTTNKESATYRLPVAYLVQGNAERARRYVQGQLAAIKTRTDIAANAYRQFAANFVSGSITGNQEVRLKREHDRPMARRPEVDEA